MDDIYSWLIINAINQLSCILEILIILICIHTVFKEKFKLSFKEILLIITNLLILALVNLGILESMFAALVCCVFFLYCIGKFKRRVLETLGKVVLSFLLAGLIEIISSVVIIPIQNTFVEKEKSMFVINMVGVLIAFLILEFMKLRRRKVRFKFGKEEWKVLIIVGTLYLGITIMDYRVRGKVDQLYYLLFFAACLLVGVTSIGKQEAKHELEEKILELEMQKVYGARYKELITEVRRKQHDYKNQLAAIYSMHLTATSLEELVQQQREYGDILLEKSRYDKILLECTNSVFAGYLYYRFVALEKDDIEVDYKINIGTVKCNLAVHEIIEILGILLTNASESFSAEDEERNIGFVLQETEENLLIEVSNKAPEFSAKQIEQMFTEGYSTKGEKRGLGLFGVKRLTQKAGADLIVENQMRGDKNWILFRILIPKDNKR